MNTNQSLKNPPIKEAIINIGFSTVSAKVDIQHISELGDSLSELFPNKSEQVAFSLGNINSSEDEILIPNSIISGYVLTSSDKRDIIQITRNSLTFNRLKPYPGWDDFIDKFKIVWASLNSRITDVVISEVSLRYINRMDFMVTTNAGAEEFFNLFPVLPRSLYSDLDKYVLQVQIPSKDEKALSIVTQTFSHCEEIDDQVHYHLDINIQKQVVDNDSLWEILEEMRTKKNAIFNDSIKESTKQKYTS